MGRTLSRIALLGLCVALVACGEASDPVVSPPPPESVKTSPDAPRERQPLPIQGNRFASKAFGFSLEKPEGWVFLEESSLMRDAPERLRHRAELWQLLDDPARVPAVPLIAVAPRQGAVPGVDPIFTAHVIPMRPEDSARGVDLLRTLKPTDVVVTFAHGTRSGMPGFQMFPPPSPGKLSGIDAASLDLRYDSEQNGAKHPTHERLYHLRRDQEFWYFRQITPEPRTEADAKALDAILASVRLDP
jgi:hypothetical protein